MAERKGDRWQYFQEKVLSPPHHHLPPVLSGHSPHQLPLGSDPTGDPSSEWEETGKARLRKHPEHRRRGWGALRFLQAFVPVAFSDNPLEIRASLEPVGVG